MKPRHGVISIWLIGLALLLMTVGAKADSAEPYKIGPEDVLSITFWQKPELNQIVKVRQDGKVAIPVIGEMEVAGLTPEEAANRIVDRISRYNREISQALVQVQAYNSRKVYITGQVAKPGTYSYEVVPDLWTAIRDAGGPLETSDLKRVTIVSPKGKISLVDLASILAAGKADTLPPLPSGTTVDLPRAAMLSSTETYDAQITELRPIVFVTGQVLQPGGKPIESDLYIYDALALAGGVTADADLGNVQVISKAPNGPVTQVMNLKPKSRDRAAMSYKIHYEDMIIVGRKGGGFWEPVRNIATVTAALTSVVLLVNQLGKK